MVTGAVNKTVQTLNVKDIAGMNQSGEQKVYSYFLFIFLRNLFICIIYYANLFTPFNAFINYLTSFYVTLTQ